MKQLLPCTRLPWLALVLATLLTGCSDNSEDLLSFAEHLENATAYREQGKLEEAVIEFKNALQSNPRSLETRAALGDLYMQLGDAVNADKEFRHVQDGRGDPALYMVGLGDALLRLYSWQDVLDRVQPDPRLSVADQAVVHAQQGSAYIELENLEAARKAFKTALELDPNCAAGLLGQAALATGEGRRASARQLIDQARAQGTGEDAAEAWRLTAELARLEGDDEQAEAAYGQAIGLTAFKGKILAARANLRTENGDYAGAHQDLDEVGRIYNRGHLYVLYGEGLLAIREGRFEDGRKFLEELLQRQPSHLKGQFYLGVAQFALGNLEDAETYLDRVVKQTPRSFSAALLLGKARFQLGRYRAAARVLEPLLVVAPDNTELQSLMGSVYLSMGATAKGSELLREVVARQPDKVSDRMKLGLSLIRLGEHETGIKELEQVVLDVPESDRARVMLLTGYLRAGNHAAARELAAGLQAAAPDQATSWLYVGVVELVAGERPAAREALERALAISPGWPPAGYNLARLELVEGDVDRARALYAEVLDQHPEHLQVLMALVSLEAASGRMEAAQELAERAMKHHPETLGPRLWLGRWFLSQGDADKALSLFEEVKEHHPEDPGFLAVLGEAELRAGNTRAALNTHQALAKLAPNDAHIQYMYARACALHGEYLCLGDALIGALRLQPEHPGLPVLLQRVIALSASPASTSKLLWQMQQVAPDNLLLTRVRGDFALHQGQYSDAVAIFKAARKRSPELWEWSERLAYAYARGNETDQALVVVDEWLAAHPDAAAAWLLQGKIRLGRGETDRAREDFARVLTFDPDNVQALNNLAWLLREQDTGQARKYAERAVKLAPGHITRDTLGVILLRLGENERAEQLLREAFGERPESVAVRFHLAEALAGLEKTLEARSLLREVLQDAADFDGRDRAEALLRELGG